MVDRGKQESEIVRRAAQDRFNRMCQRLEQAILDAELKQLEGCSAKDQRDWAYALPTIHAALMLRYMATVAAPGVDIRAAAIALIDVTILENGDEIFEIARNAKGKPH